MKLPDRRWLWIGLAAALHAAPALREGWRGSAAPEASFVLAAAPRASGSGPDWEEEFIDPAFTVPSVHVASLAELPDGRLVAAWYGGSREGAGDVAIYLATREPGAEGRWSAPRPVVTRAAATRELGRFVKKVGNAVLAADASGGLILIYVTVTVGGWSGSSLNLKQSGDGGRTWSGSRRLVLSPWFNTSELVKNPPAPLAGGGWAVPIYHETLGKFPEILWLAPASGGFSAVKTRVFGGHSAFQPALVPLDERRALLLCRACGPVPRIHLARTGDGGRRWSGPEALDLPNPDSGLDALRLADGRVLLAFNDSRTGRANLRLALSSDEGRTWRRVATLAEAAGGEFSYPFLRQTGDGRVHVLYTWQRRAIKHVSFNLAWLDARAARAGQGGRPGSGSGLTRSFNAQRPTDPAAGPLEGGRWRLGVGPFTGSQARRAGRLSDPLPCRSPLIPALSPRRGRGCSPWPATSVGWSADPDDPSGQQTPLLSPAGGEGGAALGVGWPASASPAGLEPSSSPPAQAGRSGAAPLL